MLVQLSISDFAIIKHLEISFGKGLNILSGETGAGKSIIINAMNLILGGRASSDLIRSGCKEARVEALFASPKSRHLSNVLSEIGIPFDGELLIKRSIHLEGRNRISINGSIATLQMLSRMGPVLVSISGQHEHQLLLRPETHLYLLDEFGGLSEERRQLNGIFNRNEEMGKEIRLLEEEIRQVEQGQELARFQIQEIEQAGISPGEESSLMEEKRRLQHAGELMEIVSEGYQCLYETDGSVFSTVSQWEKRLDKGAELDPTLEPMRDCISDIRVKVEDVSFSLRDFQKRIPLDPRRLEEVVERLDLLHKLKRKYGATLDDVMQFKEMACTRLIDLAERRKKLEELEKRRQEVEREIQSRARSLSEKRKKVAGELEAAVEKEVDQLHMPETRFRVKFHEEESGKAAERFGRIHGDGFDQVEFMISPNVGEELRPLSRIASGGELSRIMLGLKTILAETGSVETLVFDEVDSGIGGAAAEVVGEKLQSLAKYHQILCITHLPQIASQGETHFLVGKKVAGGRTETVITALDPEGRVREIARLLGGRRITPQALAHAREMLR